MASNLITILLVPELPEVETIVRELRKSVVGKQIRNIRVIAASSVKPSPRAVISGAKGRKIADVVRRGKFMIFILERGMRLVIHLRMTGRLTWKVEKGRSKFVRAVFDFTDGSRLYFSDVRRFGRIWVFPEAEYEKNTGIGKLGFEPLVVDSGCFGKIFHGRKSILKNTLLRQDLLAGIGNIYADEICFRIGAHPSSKIDVIGARGRGKLYGAVRECLKEGIKHCGVSVSDFVGVRGNKGTHQNYLNVYGRAGQDCRKCGDTIKRTVVAGRGTFFCPACQPVYSDV